MAQPWVWQFPGASVSLAQGRCPTVHPVMGDGFQENPQGGSLHHSGLGAPPHAPPPESSPQTAPFVCLHMHRTEKNDGPHTYTYAQARARTLTRTHKHTRTHTLTSTLTCTLTRPCMHARTQAHTGAHTCTHTPFLTEPEPQTAPGLQRHRDAPSLSCGFWRSEFRSLHVHSKPSHPFSCPPGPCPLLTDRQTDRQNYGWWFSVNHGKDLPASWSPQIRSQLF